ncbi:MAG: DNA-processing protein DprA [Porticoccaceae bacterium]|jgi:DNA processing protein
MTEQEAAVVMTMLPGIKPGIQYGIFAEFGSFSGYLQADIDTVSPSLRAPLAVYAQAQQDYIGQTREYLQRLADDNISLLPIADPLYPLLLREIHRPPLLLYVKGDPAVLSLPQIAIVGSRHGSRSGLALAEHFATSLAASGFTVTSGLALGIDGAAHRGALKTGNTVAVLGAGVDVVYPGQHGDLYGQIISQGGAVVSELPPGSKPLRHYFPQRNRIISGLSLGVLIVEAAIKSGSLITARLALEQGREVFAVPGSIHNPLARGCHQLIREGAVLTETLTDMVNQLGAALSLKSEEAAAEWEPELPESSQERAVLEKLGFDPLDFDTLAGHVALAAAELTTILVSLELQGFIENINGSYQRRR